MSSYARVDMEGKSFFNERGNVHPHQAHHPFSIEPLKLRPKQQEQAPQQETFTEVSSTVLGSQNGKDPPLSPSPSGQRDIGSPGLESVASDDKEVYDGKERAPQNPPAPPPKRRICGLPKKWFLLVTGLAVCIIVALAVALGVVFGTRDSS